MIGLVIKPAGGKGRGVFADRLFKAGETIEVCPVIVVDEAEARVIDGTSLYGYYFGWPDKGAAIALGYGSLYNHSYSPNAKYEKRLAEGTVKFAAIKSIQPGEEITVNYNGSPRDRAKLWFEVTD